MYNPNDPDPVRTGCLIMALGFCVMFYVMILLPLIPWI